MKIDSKNFFADCRFNPKVLSTDFYNLAKKNNFFVNRKSKKVFSMVLPPPNVTGILHIGHALNISVSDTIARYYQLRNYQICWIPGTDHAGIATQAKFEKILAQQDRFLSCYSTPEEAYEDIHSWAMDQQQKIISQVENLVPLLSWKKSFFTLDKTVNNLVNQVFIKLYNEKLLYRANKIVNWDVVLKTAVSDIEVIHKQQKSKLYYISYKLVSDPTISFSVATTRPETMFGDVCLFVHPKDVRYCSYVGQLVTNPINGEKIPILADNYVDMNFANGIMKCTPAHDINDYRLAKKYRLKMINIMNTDGTMNSKALQFSGEDRFQCREKVVELLGNEKVLEKIEIIDNSVGYSSRSDSVIEPLLSLQWFIKSKPIVKNILALQKKSKTSVKLFPDRFNKVLNRWLLTMDDWCISRQIIWGHKLPVYYNKKTGRMFVSEKEMNATFYSRDDSVLDTWFSSALWPIICMNYVPGKKNIFFPNSLLVTGADIIFFWIARMMLMSSFYTKKNPFKKVLITGIVRDHLNRKMSKSLGNGIDPNELIEKYGVDALRLYLVSSTTAGEDLCYHENQLQQSWNLLNKLWNATRFIFQNISVDRIKRFDFNAQTASLFDKWIMARLYTTCKKIERNFANYNFTVIGKCISDFFWEDFCSSYLEIVKIQIQKKTMNLNSSKILLFVLKHILLLLHPFCPVITENIYSYLPTAKKSILLEYFVLPSRIVVPSLASKILEFVVFLRQLRANLLIKPKERLTVYIGAKYWKHFVMSESCEIVSELTKVDFIEYHDNTDKCRNLPSFASNFGIIYVQSNLSDNNYRNQLEKKFIDCQFELKRATSMLQNQGFLNNAASDKINAERSKVKKYTIIINQLKKLLK